MGAALAAVLARLGEVPAVSLDESWIGLFASRLKSGGLYTPHQMNNYTGPLYAWAVSAILERTGPSVAALRALGAALNAAAILGALWHLRRRAGADAALGWCVLAAGSAFLLMKSRLAWEVYALHPALLVATLALLARADEGRLRAPGAAALAALSVLGTQNHFIYLSVPVSLALLYGARAAWRGEDGARLGLRAAAAALAAAAVFAALKSPLTDAAWQAARARWVLTLLAVPAAAWAAVWALPAAAWERGLSALAAPRARAALGALTLGGVAAYALWHLPPLVQILGGPVVFKRLFSLDLPWPLDLILHAWGLFLAAALAWRAAGAWHDRGRLTPHEVTLALWPAAYAAIFIAFRHTSSLRYYSLSATLALIGLAAGAARLAKADRRAFLLAGLAFAALTQGLLWREILTPADRAPLKFKIGWRRENSVDFARKEGLFAALDASNACSILDDGITPAGIPLIFRLQCRPERPCDPKLWFAAKPCPECPAPPYYRWETVTR